MFLVVGEVVKIVAAAFGVLAIIGVGVLVVVGCGGLMAPWLSYSTDYLEQLFEDYTDWCDRVSKLRK